MNLFFQGINNYLLTTLLLTYIMYIIIPSFFNVHIHMEEVVFLAGRPPFTLFLIFQLHGSNFKKYNEYYRYYYYQEK